MRASPQDMAAYAQRQEALHVLPSSIRQALVERERNMITWKADRVSLTNIGQIDASDSAAASSLEKDQEIFMEVILSQTVLCRARAMQEMKGKGTFMSLSKETFVERWTECLEIDSTLELMGSLQTGMLASLVRVSPANSDSQEPRPIAELAGAFAQGAVEQVQGGLLIELAKASTTEEIIDIIQLKLNITNRLRAACIARFLPWFQVCSIWVRVETLGSGAIAGLAWLFKVGKPTVLADPLSFVQAALVRLRAEPVANTAYRDWFIETCGPEDVDLVEHLMCELHNPGKSWALDWLAIFHRLGWGTREDKDRRGYAVSILIDVSLSMQGIFETCAREVMLMFLHSLQQMNMILPSSSSASVSKFSSLRTKIGICTPSHVAEQSTLQERIWYFGCRFTHSGAILHNLYRRLGAAKWL